VPLAGRSLQIPFLIVGCGGHGNQTVAPAPTAGTGGVSYDASYKGYGYALAEVSKTRLQIQFFSVDATAKKLIDTVTVDLTNNKVI
jgi:hypothetical protein